MDPLPRIFDLAFIPTHYWRWTHSHPYSTPSLLPPILDDGLTPTCIQRRFHSHSLWTLDLLPPISDLGCTPTHYGRFSFSHLYLTLVTLPPILDRLPPISDLGFTAIISGPTYLLTHSLSLLILAEDMPESWQYHEFKIGVMYIPDNRGYPLLGDGSVYTPDDLDKSTISFADSLFIHQKIAIPAHRNSTNEYVQEVPEKI